MAHIAGRVRDRRCPVDAADGSAPVSQAGHVSASGPSPQSKARPRPGLRAAERLGQTGRLTKVNRALTEGPRAFRGKIAAINGGFKCERLTPLFGQLAGGPSKADDPEGVRRHVRSCLSCRARAAIPGRRARRRLLARAPGIGAGAGARASHRSSRRRLGSGSKRFPGEGPAGSSRKWLRSTCFAKTRSKRGPPRACIATMARAPRPTSSSRGGRRAQRTMARATRSGSFTGSSGSGAGRTSCRRGRRAACRSRPAAPRRRARQWSAAPAAATRSSPRPRNLDAM